MPRPSLSTDTADVTPEISTIHEQAHEEEEFGCQGLAEGSDWFHAGQGPNNGSIHLTFFTNTRGVPVPCCRAGSGVALKIPVRSSGTVGSKEVPQVPLCQACLRNSYLVARTHDSASGARSAGE